MEKTMTLNLRVNPTVKQQAEDTVDAASAFAQFREQHR